MEISEIYLSVPELPDDFEMWCRNYPLGYSKYMFTFRDEAGSRQGYCTHCEKIVDLEWKNKRTLSDDDFTNCNRKHNEYGYCPECHSKVTFKDNGRGKSKIWDYDKAVILQRVDNTKIAVLRFFDVMRNYSDCNKTPVKTHITEEYRLFLDFEHSTTEMYKRRICYESHYSFLYYGGCRMGEADILSGWEKLARVNTNLTRYGSCSFYGIEQELINKEFGDTPLKYCRIDDYCDMPHPNGYVNIVKYLERYCKNPGGMEFLMKSGLENLCADYLQYHTHHIFNFSAKTPEKFMRLSKLHIKYFIKNSKKQNCINVDYMQQLEKLKLSEADRMRFFETVDFYDFQNYWNKILQYTTAVKVENYLKKQKGNNKSLSVSDYTDYLKYCKKLEYDLTQSYILFPKNLHNAHQRCVEISRAKDEAERKLQDKKQRLAAAKKNAAFSKNISKQYEILCKKYEFHSNGLFVCPAKNLKEIKDEGKTQHICVGSDNMSYIKNHASGVAFICFIRKESEPDTPYYTVEITNQDVVCQCRGKSNCGKTDEVEVFIKAWKKYLSKAEVKKSA